MPFGAFTESGREITYPQSFWFSRENLLESLSTRGVSMRSSLLVCQNDLPETFS